VRLVISAVHEELVEPEVVLGRHDFNVVQTALANA
jgi:hypothetical protein